MEIAKNFEPSTAERKWYQHWLDQGYFHSEPDSRPPYTVVIPPPNVTGVLHMGHTLNETVQDILVRRARMQGYNACWVPGSDHASIATEAKVVAMLKERGIAKSDLGREEFLRYAFEWKEKYGGIIYHQIQRLGCSCDWDRVSFTMDDHYYKAVIRVFVDLYRKGLIYRGARMIHWDPAARTALSDEEVEYREVQSQLYYVSYRLEGSDQHLTVATTRPETIMGDTAICVHPEDSRYRHLIGTFARVPLLGRKIPVIADEYVDKEFGTGCLKVTPAHDINDYNLGLKHHLDVIDVFNEDGTMSAAAQLYVGVDRFEVRRLVAEDLKKAGQLVKVESILNKNGFSQRSHAVVEPRISTQWFLKMELLAAPALEAVRSGAIRLFPQDRFTNTYRHWMENIKDWCISRQLWWGQRIPAWYDQQGRVVVAETQQEALLQYELTYGTRTASLHQDEDVLDTWFSSWLWPMEVFHGLSDPEGREASYYYPTSALVTGQDILFFWVARMIMAGMEYRKEIPFRDVYFTGMVRDKQGRKMSKSLGNSPDLLELLDRYGADAVRFGIMISSPAGNDLLFDEAGLEQGRFFSNKLWNAMKLVKSWSSVSDSSEEPFAVSWFREKLLASRTEIDGMFAEYKISEALKTIYSLIWNDFCSWYLEWIKPEFGAPVASFVLDSTLLFFDSLLQLLHPFMPFLTEELYHLLQKRAPSDDLVIRQADVVGKTDLRWLQWGTLCQQAISALRDLRNKHQIKFKEQVRIFIETSRPEAYTHIQELLSRQLNAEVSFCDQAQNGCMVAVMETDTFYMKAEMQLDLQVQKEQLSKDLAYQEKFLRSVEAKLNNEKFVSNAKKEVVDQEYKKKADAEARMEAIRQALKLLS